MPSNLLSPKNAGAPLWLQIILERWPSLRGEGWHQLSEQPDGPCKILMSCRSTRGEGHRNGYQHRMRAIRPGASQRGASRQVRKRCWAAGSRWVELWPWVMSGENAVFPNPLASLCLLRPPRSQNAIGRTCSLDVGCEYKHYPRRSRAHSSGFRATTPTISAKPEHLCSRLSKGQFQRCAQA